MEIMCRNILTIIKVIYILEKPDYNKRRNKKEEKNMNTKTMKILTTIATVLVIVSMGASIVYGLTPSEMIGSEPKSTEIKDLGNKIIGILQTVGIVLSVVILVVLGIKYMMGSAEEKAEYKKTMIPYIVGAAFCFLAPTIANIVYNFFKTK